MMDPIGDFVNRFRSAKRKRLGPSASNPRGHANRPGEPQTLSFAEYKRRIHAELRDLATASPSSSRPRRQAPVESQPTRETKNQDIRIWRQRVCEEAEPDNFGDVIINNTSQAHPALSYHPLDALEHPDPTYRLETEGFHCAGRLAREASYFEDEDMDEVATQPATQPYFDQRRQGIDASLSDKDKCDVVCILHPISNKAETAVQFVADHTPQHILQNENLLHMSKDGSDSVIESSTRSVTASPHESMLHGLTVESKPQDAFAIGKRAKDIALRLSSTVNDPCLGFTFGRSALKSDIIIGANEETWISNMHFRIYLNKSGILMLEDTSTNGTVVGAKYLHADTNKHPNAVKRQMLDNMTMISLLMSNKETKSEDQMRFVVSIPSRSHMEDQWEQKLATYLELICQIERMQAVRAEVSHNGAAKTALYPMKLHAANARQDLRSNIDSRKALVAGSRLNPYGMAWDGGEKYNVTRCIGQGGFAVVYLLATKHDGDLYAAKQIDKRRFIKNGILDNKLKNEMDIMKDLEHPQIVKFIDHHETPRHLYLIMEFVPSGDLSGHIGQMVFEIQCQQIASQICSALEYLHSRNIAHRDIKPENILVVCFDPANVKLSDFGLSKRITNDDAFLQTFCGTILYCAPEIYPGYDRYKSGKTVKRRRPNDPPLKTSPYQNSVDIWAFAAVLYHLLCGCPPYEGNGEDHGELMLETVMNNEVNFEKLRFNGVSDAGVDFISRMLKHDPLARATAAQCLQHPWITQMAGNKAHKTKVDDTSSLGVIREDEDDFEPSQLSKLSLTEKPAEAEIVDSDMEYESDVDELADTRLAKRLKFSNEANRGTQRVLSGQNVAYPSLPSAHVGSALSPPTNRLFGEIGSSALRSSGVLGHNARAALEMPSQRSRDKSTSPIHSILKDQQVSSDELAQHPLQYPHTSPETSLFTTAAPSLLGAEAMVRQLNMASTVSAPSPDGIAMPQTTLFSESTGSSSKRSSQVIHPTDESTPKRGKLDLADASSQRSQPGDSSESHRSHGTQTTSRALSEPSALATAAENSSGGDKGKGKEGSMGNSADAKEEADFDLLASVGPAFAPARECWGVLTPVSGSIVNTTIKLEQRMTCFGRATNSHVKYLDNMDTRVPKNALDIIFWRPGFDELAKSGVYWEDVDGLFALAHTRTSIYIKVNGVKLTRGEDCWIYGRLHTGDTITIFGPERGREEGRAAEFLSFRCEFFFGASARPREEPFRLERSYIKWELSQQKKAQQAAAQAQGQANTGAGAQAIGGANQTPAVPTAPATGH